MTSTANATGGNGGGIPAGGFGPGGNGGSGDGHCDRDFNRRRKRREFHGDRQLAATAVRQVPDQADWAATRWPRQRQPAWRRRMRRPRPTAATETCAAFLGVESPARIPRARAAAPIANALVRWRLDHQRGIACYGSGERPEPCRGPSAALRKRRSMRREPAVWKQPRSTSALPTDAQALSLFAGNGAIKNHFNIATDSIPGTTQRHLRRGDAGRLEYGGRLRGQSHVHELAYVFDRFERASESAAKSDRWLAGHASRRKRFRHARFPDHSRRRCLREPNLCDRRRCECLFRHEEAGFRLKRRR